MKERGPTDRSALYRQLLLAPIMLVICASAFLTYKTIVDYRHSRVTSERLIRAEGNIRYYDEALTMSARAFVFTGDPQWKVRYDICQGKLASELNAISTLLPRLKEPLERISQANTRRTELDLQAFAFVEKGDAAQAQRIMLSAEHERERDKYTYGALTLGQTIDAFISISETNIKQNTLLSVCVVSGLTIIFLLAFLRTFRALGYLLLMERIRGDVAKRMLSIEPSQSEVDIVWALKLIVHETRGDCAFLLRRSQKEGVVYLQQWWDEGDGMADGRADALWSGLMQLCKDASMLRRDLSRLPAAQRQMAEGVLQLGLRWVSCAHVSTGHGDEYCIFWGSKRRVPTWLRPSGPFLQSIAEIAIGAIKNLEYETALTRLATTDGLTHVNNRHHFTECLARELRLYHRTKRPCALLMLDLDHFKSVNDTFGHAAGDTVLVHFAERLGGELRDVDTIGRLGGEEFGIILPDTDFDSALGVAERLHENLQNAEIEIDGEKIKVTACIGVTVLDSGDTSTTQPMSRADDALYCAKEEGRNRVRHRMPARPPAH